MKRHTYIFLTTLVVLFSLPSFAQTEKDYKWGCGIAINSVDAQIGTPLKSSWGAANDNLYLNGDKTESSYSLSIVPKYFISNDVALRFEIGMTNLKFTKDTYQNSNTPGAQNTIRNEMMSQKIYRYNAGIQWNFIKKKHIELYCGATLCYIHYNEMNYNVYGESRQMPTNTLVNWAKANITFPGGYSAGIGALTGFNIYLQKHISLGAEFSSSLLYNKIGGEYTEMNTSYYYLANPTTTENSNTSSSLYKGTQFSKILSSFNISVWF